VLARFRRPREGAGHRPVTGTPEGGAAGIAVSALVSTVVGTVVSAGGDAAGPFAGKNILITEDNFLVAEVLEIAVQDGGGTVTLVPTRAAAFEHLVRQSFDGAILDYQLRDGTSVPIARELNRRDIPFIFATGFERDWLPEDLRDAPYLAKPYLLNQLVDTASGAFEKNRSRRGPAAALCRPARSRK
jgi:CheY-like chemotaxis protein